jgi:hypothetical protein
MIPLPLALAAVMHCVSHEYVVEFGLVPAVPFQYKLELEFWARDGTSLSVPVLIPKDDDNPEATSATFLWALKDNKWVARHGPGATLIVTGTKMGSPIKYITVTSELVLPIQMRWVLLPP